MIGLVGAHRTGKTTLAKEFSLKSGIPFVPVHAGEVFKRFRIDPSADMGLETRIAVQRAILAEATEQWGRLPAPFVTDRTPIDMLGYTLMDVTASNVTPEMEVELANYVSECFAACNRHFGILVLVQPGIQVVQEDWKGVASEIYRYKLNILLRGLLMNNRATAEAHAIGERTVSLEARVGLLAKIVGERLAREAQSAQSYSKMAH